MPTTEQDLRGQVKSVVKPYAAKLERVAQAALRGEVHDEPNPSGTDMISAIVELIQLDRINQRLDELSHFGDDENGGYYLRAEFNGGNLRDRVCDLESQKNQLTKGAQE